MVRIGIVRGLHNEQFNDVFRSGGGDTGDGNEKECVVEDIGNKSSHRHPTSKLQRPVDWPAVNLPDTDLIGKPKLLMVGLKVWYKDIGDIALHCPNCWPVVISFAWLKVELQLPGGLRIVRGTRWRQGTWCFSSVDGLEWQHLSTHWNPHHKSGSPSLILS